MISQIKWETSKPRTKQISYTKIWYPRAASWLNHRGALQNSLYGVEYELKHWTVCSWLHGGEKPVIPGREEPNGYPWERGRSARRYNGPVADLQCGPRPTKEDIFSILTPNTSQKQLQLRITGTSLWRFAFSRSWSAPPPSVCAPVPLSVRPVAGATRCSVLCASMFRRFTTNWPSNMLQKGNLEIRMVNLQSDLLFERYFF